MCSELHGTAESAWITNNTQRAPVAGHSSCNLTTINVIRWSAGWVSRSTDRVVWRVLFLHCVLLSADLSLRFYRVRVDQKERGRSSRRRPPGGCREGVSPQRKCCHVFPSPCVPSPHRWVRGGNSINALNTWQHFLWRDIPSPLWVVSGEPSHRNFFEYVSKKCRILRMLRKKTILMARNQNRRGA